MKYYCYRHIRLDKNEPFYIGIGTKRNREYSLPTSEYERAFSKLGRNKYWKNIVANTEYEVEIIFESNFYEEIKEKEKEFILLYNNLSNMTGGGEGTLGLEPWNKGLNMWADREHPNIGKKASKETCYRKSEAMKNSEKNLKGKKLPKWWRDKISENVRGKNNHMYGKTGALSVLSKRVINIENKEIYNSIGEASETIKYSMKYLSGMLNGDKNNLTNFVFESIFIEKGYNFCKTIVNMGSKPKVGNCKKVIDTITKIEYNSIKKLAFKLGTSAGTLRKNIREGKTIYKYI